MDDLTQEKTSEAVRLRVLAELNLLNSPREQVYDDIARLAAQICDVPMAHVSLIDAHREWIKAAVGIDEEEFEKNQSIGVFALADLESILEIEDAREDLRFRELPSVRKSPGVCFYAAAPIVLHGGEVMGTVSVADHKARVLSDSQRQLLGALARQCAALFDARLQNHAMMDQARELADFTWRTSDERRHSTELLDTVLRAGDLGLWDLDVVADTWTINEREREIFGYTRDEATPSALNWQSLIHPDDQAMLDEAMQEHLAGRTPHYRTEMRMRHKDGHWLWILSRALVVKKSRSGKALRIVGTHLDVTERKELQFEIERTADLLKRTNAMAQVGGWEFDLVAKRITWSDEVYRIHEVNPLHEPNMEMGLSFYPSEARPTIEAALDAAVGQGISWDLELPFVTALNNHIWIRSQGRPVLSEGKTVRLVGAFQDITQRKRAEIELLRKNEQLAQLSVTDELTGLANRRAIDKGLEREWARRRRDGEPITMLMIDIDYFKRFNDSHGHLAGDECLKHVAKVLGSLSRRPEDIVGRFGGEEFVVILPRMDLTRAKEVAQTCIEKVRHSKLDVGFEPCQQLTVSVGIAVMMPSDEEASADLVKAADAALYRAKKAGRDRFSV